MLVAWEGLELSEIAQLLGALTGNGRGPAAPSPPPARRRRLPARTRPSPPLRRHIYDR